MESDSKVARMEIKNSDLIQLYSACTPNGIKVAACLEEIVALRRLAGDGFDYEPHTVNIRAHESRDKDFMSFNPNGKIPMIIDPHGPNGNRTVVFESGAILMYLSDKFHELSPTDPQLKTETIKWLFWGSTGFSSQCKHFGFYYKYCHHKLPYCVERYSTECCRLLSVLEVQLSSHGKHWVTGDFYTIADLAIWPWLYALNELYDDARMFVFRDFNAYPHVQAWYTRCMARPASQKSLEVTRLF